MSMLCIAGTFRVTGTEPDGDSIRFVPRLPSDWAKVPGRNHVRVNAYGGAQLRLDAIDALETHYAPRGSKQLHQPVTFAHRAAKALLTWAGFTGIERSGETVKHVDADDRPGYLLTRGADKYGRCVALIGRGEAPVASGEQAFLDVDGLRETANWHLVDEALAYPTFYSLLFHDLRDELAAVARRRRAEGAGLYAEDATTKGATVHAMSDLTDHAVILPKLFRRLADYLALGAGDHSLDGFAAYLAQRDDRVLVIPTAQKTGFDTVVEVTGSKVRLTVQPEELVFDEA